MLSKRMQDVARSIERARWKLQGNQTAQDAISEVTRALADDHCNGTERAHFLLASGTPLK